MEPQVCLNNFQTQWQLIRGDVIAALERVGRSGWLVLGAELSRFEQRLAQFASVAHAVGCASGLDAIEISLRILGIKPGELVLTTPCSAFATTLGIIRAGGVPIFVDVDETGLLDLKKVEAFLRDNSGRSRFLIPVHLFGHSINLTKLGELQQTYKIHIVEDCAQAIGASSGERTIASVAEISALSFYPTKNLGCFGDGGAILTNEQRYAEVATCLRNYGQTSKYRHTALGLNSRLDELQAAIMSEGLLPRLGEFTERRREIASIYRREISHPQLIIPPVPPDSHSVYHLFPLLVREHRDQFRNHLGELGIETAIHYPMIIPEQPALKDQPYEIYGELLKARFFAEHEVSIPIHPYLMQSELERVITACNSWRQS